MFLLREVRGRNYSATGRKRNEAVSGHESDRHTRLFAIDPQGQAMFDSFKEPEVLDCIFFQHSKEEYGLVLFLNASNTPSWVLSAGLA